MKKTFQLKAPGKEDQRVVEAIKNEVRKYVKRERRKTLPEGVDFWDFDCRVGQDKAEPVIKHLAEVAGAIDAAALTEGATEVYVEILAKPGHRTKKPVAAVLEGLPPAETASGEAVGPDTESPIVP
jgi:hypothetical protein